MGCSGCETGRGNTNTNTPPAGCGSHGTCNTQGCNKFTVFDWLSNMALPSGEEQFQGVEVRFKNDRKGYFLNVDKLPLAVGDAVSVEASPGHDIGTVSLTGELVKLQMSKRSVTFEEMKKLYRKARQTDIDKWNEAIAMEKPTMQKARQFAIDLGLNMKIGDVEFQGDKTKATFFYTANGRVDFRQLIKMYAENFRVRVEMRQIGSRQEASKLGGVGSCGRELCCSTWLSDFRSVNTSAARYQQLSLNPQKLAGQCGKLKCCLNFELDSYLDAIKEFPQGNTELQLKKSAAFQVKTDIFKGLMYYIVKDEPSVFHAVPVARVKEIMLMNRKGEQPEFLLVEQPQSKQLKKAEPDYDNVVGESDLTRFDRKKNNPPRNNNNNRNAGPRNPNNNNPRPNNPNNSRGPRPNNPRPNEGGGAPRTNNNPDGTPRSNNAGQGRPNNNPNAAPRPNNEGGQNRGPRPNNNRPPQNNPRPNNPPTNNPPQNEAPQ